MQYCQRPKWRGKPSSRQQAGRKAQWFTNYHACSPQHAAAAGKVADQHIDCGGGAGVHRHQNVAQPVIARPRPALVLVHLDLGRAELDARACTRGTQSLSAEMRHFE